MSNSENLRVPCIMDPVRVECPPECPNHQYGLRILQQYAEKMHVTLEEASIMITKIENPLDIAMIVAASYRQDIQKACKMDAAAFKVATIG